MQQTIPKNPRLAIFYLGTTDDQCPGNDTQKLIIAMSRESFLHYLLRQVSSSPVIAVLTAFGLKLIRGHSWAVKMVHGIESTWPDMGHGHLSERIVEGGKRSSLNFVGTGGRGRLAVRVTACVSSLLFLLGLLVQPPGATGEIFPYKDMDLQV